MGSCSSAGSAVAAGVEGTANTCHPTENDDGMSLPSDTAPMWVVKVEHVLAMADQLPPHQILKAQGLMEKWVRTMFTIFVSHQWFGHRHPDPHGAKLKVLQGLLSNLTARKLKIQWDVISEFYSGVLPEVEVQRLHTAHIWLDYFSIPQLVDSGPTPHLDYLEENPLQYVDAIPTFVSHCDLFVALVPSDRHSDTGLQCSFNSWLQRGWCRKELWCHVLSARSEQPIVVVRSPDSAQYTAPVWHRYPVHLGEFSVEEDRARCCQVLQTAFANHVSELCRSKRKTAYRLYLSLFEEMAGLDPRCRSVEDFLREFSFSTVVAQRRDHSLSPVACAALSGDCRLVRALVIARASLQNHAPAMPEVLHLPGFTPLHLALWFKSHDLRMLETLLDLRADPNTSGINLLPPLSYCLSVGAVDLLVQHGAGVNFGGAYLFKYLPIHILGGNGAPCEVVARMIELKADVHGGHGGLASASPLHLLAYAAGDSRNTLEVAQLLLESRANINQVCQAEGICRSMELIFRAYGRFCRIKGTESGAVVRFSRDASATPLGWCFLLENEGLLTFLLRARADPEIRNNRGLRPIDFARSDRIQAILKDPNQSIYLLEHDSELVTHNFCLDTLNIADRPRIHGGK